ncbi:hypothetical protein KY360_02575 [Candidatus Woesearchaeota archaeon]|nr:hypothetical protein [Candidatus Woesearchaeota archaeon]
MTQELNKAGQGSPANRESSRKELSDIVKLEAKFQAAVREATEGSFTDEEGEEKFYLHDLDIDTLRVYAAKVHLAIHPEEDPEPTIRIERDALGERAVVEEPVKDPARRMLLAEVVLGTVMRIFTTNYAYENYGTDFGLIMDGEMDHPTVKANRSIQMVANVTRKLWDKVGVYEMRKYGNEPAEVEAVFSGIISGIYRESVSRHIDAIYKDKVLGAKPEGQRDEFSGFRGAIAQVDSNLSRAIPLRGRIRADYLKGAFSAMDHFMEKYVSEHLGGEDSARKKAEALLIDMEILRTVANRYYDFRCNGHLLLRSGMNGEKATGAYKSR